MESDGFVVHWNDGRSQLALAGELDRFEVPALESAFAERAPSEDLILDLTELTFIDVGALGALIGLNSQLQGQGLRLVLAGSADHVRRLLSVTGLDQVFDLVESCPPTRTT
jgi:anti-anti-sigma factor